MSWHFSQALVAEYSAVSCLDGAQSAPSSETPTHGTFWSPGKTTDASPRSRSGMTYAPFTDAHGEGLLMWFREAFPARTSALQERAQDSTENGLVFGPKCGELLARFDHGSSSWKTPQLSLFGEGCESLETLPPWGMWDNGELWARTMPAHLTSAIESGLWQTPVADDAVDRKNGKWNSRGEPKLSAQVLWPTPNARDYNGAPSQMERNTKPLNAEVGGSLNPTWVEWLMGWPLGWTDCAVSATAKFQQWLRSHGGF